MTPETFCDQFATFAEASNGVAKLRELILQLAVQGQLVPQDAKDKPISTAVLCHSLAEVSSSGSGAGCSKNLPTSWVFTSLEHVCHQVTDGEHITPPREPDGKVPLVTAKNVRDGFLDLMITDFVSNSTAETCWRRCRPTHDDILMVCVGATTGRLTVLNNPPPMVIVRSVALFRPMADLITPAYLAVVLRSPIGQSQIWGSVKQSAQPCLYISKSKSLPVPLPPLAEQRRIVAKVDQLLGLCDELASRQEARRSEFSNAITPEPGFHTSPASRSLRFASHYRRWRSKSGSWRR